MSTPAQKPRPAARSTTTRLSGTRPGGEQGVGQREPGGHVERVDRRVVDDHLGDPVVPWTTSMGMGAVSSVAGPDAAVRGPWGT